MAMKKTQILDQSRKLFNENGVANVTIRQIAKSLNMSSGNLNYHFKKRKDILEALYDQFEEVQNEFVDSVTAPGVTLGKYKKKTLSLMELMSEYRFVWIDTVQLNRESNQLKRRQTKAFKNRASALNKESHEFIEKWIYTCAIQNKRFSKRTILDQHKKLVSLK